MKQEGKEKPNKTLRYADAWGIRKLTSHCLRALRQDRLPRVLWQHKLGCLYTCVGFLFGKHTFLYSSRFLFRCTNSSVVFGSMLRPRCVLYLIDLSPGMSSIFSRSTSGPGILKLLFPEHSLTTQKSQPSKTIPRTGVEHTNSPRIIDSFSNFFANPYTASRSLNDDSLYFVFLAGTWIFTFGRRRVRCFHGGGFPAYIWRCNHPSTNCARYPYNWWPYYFWHSSSWFARADPYASTAFPQLWTRRFGCENLGVAEPWLQDMCMDGCMCWTWTSPVSASMIIQYLNKKVPSASSIQSSIFSLKKKHPRNQLAVAPFAPAMESMASQHLETIVEVQDSFDLRYSMKIHWSIYRLLE